VHRVNDVDAGLPAASASLVRLSAAIGARWTEERIRPLMEAAHASTPPAEVEEALLQAYLFVGYPGALRALSVWRQVAGPVAHAGRESTPDSWPGRGERVCRQVYGGAYDRLRDNIAALHADMGEWMVTEGYGKVLGRPGLPLGTRELCIIALLAAQGAREQLHSHLRGALRVGVPAETVDAAIRAAGEILGVATLEETLEIWESVRTRSEKADT
jgi:4-carboxymuconolactone decarboxylase